MSEIRFRAGRRSSSSCSGYREIIKSGDLQLDMLEGSDDAISISKEHLTGRIIIDCNKKTGEFSIKF